MADRTRPSADPLDYFQYDDLEAAVRAHLPPVVWKIALKWNGASDETAVDDFIDALEPHVADLIPSFRELVAHVKADTHTVAGICEAVSAKASVLAAESVLSY